MYQDVPIGCLWEKGSFVFSAFVLIGFCFVQIFSGAQSIDALWNCLPYSQHFFFFFFWNLPPHHPSNTTAPARVKQDHAPGYS